MTREHPFLRPSPRPLRVFAARRSVQHRGPRQARGGVRPAGARAHRPRGHERRGRALQGLPQTRRQADPGLRDLPRRRSHEPLIGARRAQPSHAAGGLRHRLPQPRQALLGGLSRGAPPRQTEPRHGPARRTRGGHHRPHGLPGVALLPAPGRRSRRRGAGAHRRPDERRRARQRLLRDPEERHRRSGEGQRGDRADRARGRAPARRHRRRALPAPRGLPPPHGAAVRADEIHARRAEDDLRHERVLPALERGDGRGLRGVARGDRLDAGDRRALRRHHRARAPAHPALPARGRGRAGLPARARDGGAARPLWRSGALRRRRARRDGARGHRPHGLQRLLPDRLGLRQVGQGQRHRRRPRARQRRRVDRRLHAAHHRRRSAALRPALRALPQPRARVDAGYRHRLLGARARARHAVRGREVRARVGRPDHHLRQDVPAGRDPRRRARAGSRLRDRRSPGQAHPRSRAGAPADLRSLPAAGGAAARRVRHRRHGQADRRRGARPRGHRPQRVDPRRGRRHRRDAADRRRTASAGRLGRRRQRERQRRREGLQARHPALHEAGRGARPAEDGLPGPAQPRRHRGRAGHHRALERPAPGHDQPAARRRSRPTR